MVKEGEPYVELEAMKMIMPIKAGAPIAWRLRALVLAGFQPRGRA